MIKKEIINRYSEFKRLLRNNDIDFDVGKYWLNHKNFFDCELTESGPKNLGEVNYLENEIKKEKKHNFNDEDLFFINEKIFKKSLQSEVLRYYYKIINSKKKNNFKNILEIGAGGGILSSILKDKFKSRIVIVDIPDMILVSSAQMINIFPNSNICFPNEIKQNKDNLKKFDIIYLLPNQINILENEFFDLAINTESFMEMDYEEVKKYLNLISNTTNDGGYFFTSNRIRKVQRFFSYPWKEMKNFKKIFLNKHKIFNKSNTHIILMLEKNKNTEFKNNSITFFEKIYYQQAYGINERLFWIKRDLKNFIKRFINKILNKEVYKIQKF